MIKIEKPAKPPKILMEKGAVENRNNCTDYDRSPEDYSSGRKRFKFKKGKGIYGAQSVKKALLCAQHGKCCYCESKISHIDHGDVEHYRPKGAVKQVKRQRVEYPGYYWLAYDWNNLFVSCAVCNQSHKGELFPLENPDVRARSHHDSIDNERPLFVNPAIEDPRRHIRFRGATTVPRTKFGSKTIIGMGLNRPALEEDRRELLEHLRVHYDITRLGATRPNDQEFQALVKRSQAHLDAAIRPNAEYSSMISDLLDPP